MSASAGCRALQRGQHKDVGEPYISATCGTECRHVFAMRDVQPACGVWPQTATAGNCRPGGMVLRAAGDMHLGRKGGSAPRGRRPLHTSGCCLPRRHLTKQCHRNMPRSGQVNAPRGPCQRQGLGGPGNGLVMPTRHVICGRAPPEQRRETRLGEGMKTPIARAGGAA